MFGGMDTFQKFFINTFKMIISISFITTMAIQTGCFYFHPEDHRMWKSSIIHRMAISTTKIPMIRLIKIGGINYKIWIHAFFYFMTQSFIQIIVGTVPMAFKT